ncbi:hypothetical protein DFO54_11626 [Erwinia sp. AG740]|nr:hypothetical protein DFO54_11626 [Erwinia sp. AG740]
MEGPFEGICPLCKSPKTYFSDDHGNVHRYQCNSCKRVHASRRAEELLSDKFASRIGELSAISASLKDGEALDITYAIDDGKLIIKSRIVSI